MAVASVSGHWGFSPLQRESDSYALLLDGATVRVITKSTFEMIKRKRGAVNPEGANWGEVSIRQACRAVGAQNSKGAEVG